MQTGRHPDVGATAVTPPQSKCTARLAGLPRGRPTRWTQEGQLPALERSRAGPAVWRARVGQAAGSRHDSGGQSQPEPTFRFFIRSILSCLNKYTVDTVHSTQLSAVLYSLYQCNYTSRVQYSTTTSTVGFYGCVQIVPGQNPLPLAASKDGVLGYQAVPIIDAVHVSVYRIVRL